MPHPVAYIRRSARSRTDPGDISREFQVEKVRSLAGPDADQLVVIDQDWGRSASTDKTDQRLAFLRLLADVEAGEVSALYAYATDRLARSVEWAARLLNACRRAHVTIFTSEGRFEPDNYMTDQLFYFQAMQNEGYSRQASQKRRATVAIQKARGDVLGQKPYGSLPGEDAQAVVDAFREAGSYHGAVRLLIERGIPSRRAHLGQTWQASTVRRVLLREAPGLVPIRTQSGSRTIATRIFSRLLVCPHDGTIMTTMGRSDASPAYLCREGHRAPRGTHPRPWVVAETRILPWAMAEADKVQRLDVTWDEQARSASEAAIDHVNAKRFRWLEMYAEGAIDKADRDRRLAEVERERADLEAVRRIRSFTLRQGIDWTAPPGVINARLRELWRSIRLAYVLPGGQDPVAKPALVPVEAEWIVTPEELVAREEAAEQRLQGA